MVNPSFYENIKSMSMKLYTDGGARGNPGPAAAGIVIVDKGGNKVNQLGVYLGELTNNQAEYKALILGLEKAVEADISVLECYLDSELVVKQLKGEYKVKNAGLRDLWSKAKSLEEIFDSVDYIHVKRNKNQDADSLVNQVLDEFEKSV